MKTVFFGTPEFGAIVLEKLIKGNFKPVLVVTSPDKPVGRNQILTPPAVKVLAEKYSLPVLQPEALDQPQLKQIFLNTQPDLIVVAAYGPPFLPKDILEMPRYGCINLHPSLLPKYRGASPIPYQILNGEKETGVTLIRMSAKIDQGDILLQEKTPILDSDTTGSLSPRLADLGGDLLVKGLPLLLQGKLAGRAQGDSPTPYCRQLKKEDGEIGWSKTSDFIERQVRAFDPWPGTFTRWGKKTLKILKARAINEMPNQAQPGFVFLRRQALSKKRTLAVQTSQGSLEILELQPEGKKSLPAQEFLRGHEDIIGTTLN